MRCEVVRRGMVILVFAALPCGWSSLSRIVQAAAEAPAAEAAADSGADGTAGSADVQTAVAAGRNPVSTIPVELIVKPQVDALRLRLSDVTVRALERNKQLQVQKINPAIARAQVLTQLGLFDQTLSLQLQKQANDVPSKSSSYPGFVGSETRIANLNYQTRFHDGTQLSSSFNNQRYWVNSFFPTPPNPYYQSSVVVTATRPLVKGAGRRVVNAQVNIARNTVIQNLMQLKKSVLDTVQTAEKQYWELYFSREDREVKAFNVQASQELLDYNQSRLLQGLASEVDVVEAKAALANNVAALRIAERTVQLNQSTLRRSISLDDRRAGLEIVPADRVVHPGKPLPLDRALETAYARRPDYQNVLIDLNNKDLNIVYLRNQKRPQVDLIASYQSNGLERAWSHALGDVESNEYPGYTVGVQIGIPLSNRTARGNHEQGVLQKRQALLSVKAVEDQIDDEVTQAHSSLEVNLDRVGVTRQAAQYSEEQYKAAVARYQQGLIANYNLLQYLQDLATARSAAVRALVDAVESRVDYDAATGTLLELRSIVVEDSAAKALKVPLALPGRQRPADAVPAATPVPGAEPSRYAPSR
ncbi:MAG: TolC family protein [Candidatus Riflebacteria bacterium]|nr:TolC family protein [Candidatus Riflebacteria bacterium]